MFTLHRRRKSMMKKERFIALLSVMLILGACTDKEDSAGDTVPTEENSGNEETNDSQIGTLSNPVPFGSTTTVEDDSKASINFTVIDAIRGEEAIQLYTDYLSPEPLKVLAELSSEELAELSPEELTEIAPEEFAELSPEELAELSPEELAEITEGIAEDSTYTVEELGEYTSEELFKVIVEIAKEYAEDMSEIIDEYLSEQLAEIDEFTSNGYEFVGVTVRNEISNSESFFSMGYDIRSENGDLSSTTLSYGNKGKYRHNGEKITTVFGYVKDGSDYKLLATPDITMNTIYFDTE
ncbi:hypothetical protein [Jeotgalibacillus marinus]|uniref:Uncharacterized protein n=1 Tax=Jeotgalibacillus marinus TaxID=86667 RepID=A0ABV3Q7N0_9BACL